MVHADVGAAALQVCTHAMQITGCFSHGPPTLQMRAPEAAAGHWTNKIEAAGDVTLNHGMRCLVPASWWTVDALRRAALVSLTRTTDDQ